MGSLGCTRWNHITPNWVNNLSMFNKAYIRHSMHGFSVISMVEEFFFPHTLLYLSIGTLYMVAFSTSLQVISQSILTYPRILCQIVPCIFFSSHLLWLKMRSFLSTQMVQRVIPCSKSQILETLLNAKRNFLTKNACCQSSGFHGTF